MCKAFGGLFRYENVRGCACGHRCVDSIFTLNKETLCLPTASGTMQFCGIDYAWRALGEGILKVQFHSLHPTEAAYELTDRMGSTMQLAHLFQA
ncbi:hypothetical protein GCM10009604_13230 [Corynebacterium aurimucosum]